MTVSDCSRRGFLKSIGAFAVAIADIILLVWINMPSLSSEPSGGHSTQASTGWQASLWIALQVTLTMDVIRVLTPTGVTVVF
jgi:hypothetical protein